MNPDPRIDQSLEGRLTEAEWEQFQEEMLEDGDLLAQYVEQRWLHAELLADRELMTDLASPTVTSSPPRKSDRTPWLGWAAAAVMTLLGAFAFLFSGEKSVPTVATLIEAEGCRWEGSDLPTREGAKLGPGLLSLAEGMATIRFDSGATVTLEAPTRLQVDSAMRCRLLEGSVVADVPDSAHGFTIDTDRLEVIDLGTKFGVTSTPMGNSHVFVFDGEVKVLEEDQKEARHVLGGKSLHFGQSPGSPDEEVERSPLPPKPSGNWIPISTADGSGKDAFVRRDNAHSGAGSGPLLMVKHTELAAGNERRALLTFDLGSLNSDPVVKAKLSLKIEPSGLGFSSLVPDSEFSVYGLLDSATADWDENTVTWENAGIFSAEPIDTSQFSRLAGFTIPKGSAHTLIDVSSEKLAAFLSENAGSSVTLLLVRETGESDRQGLVHAFASKEHPTSPAPTLWIQTDNR